jgi:hypothetical protein
LGSIALRRRAEVRATAVREGRLEPRPVDSFAALQDVLAGELHELATGMSFFTLAVVVVGMIGIEHGLGVEGVFTNQSLVTVFLMVGIGGHVAGCTYYIRRLEP